MRHRLVLTVLSASLALGGAASAQSPAASPVPSPEPIGSPAATPFPWPTLAPPADEPDLVPFEPTGPPDARGRRFGVVVELWLSSPTVEQAEWVQAHVRVTNTLDDAVWGPGGCSLPTHVTADLSRVYAPGETWTGEAAAFKRRAVRERRLLQQPFIPDVVQPASADAGTALALTDCGGQGSDVRRLGPGRTVDFDFAWYPADRFHGDDEDDRWVRPLPPGRVPVMAAYDFISHGSRPSDNSITEPVAATATLELTGTDPGIPSPPELLDAALHDPLFATWVAADPTRESWTATYVGGWPGPAYPRQERFQGLGGVAPDGVVEVELIRDLPGHEGTIGRVMVDPWTAEVLSSSLDCGDRACPAGLEIAQGGDGPGRSRITKHRVMGREADGSSVVYTVRDASGRLGAARLPTDGERSRIDRVGRRPALVRLDGDGRSLVLGWIGPPCDEHVTVRIDARVARIHIVDRSRTCDAAGDGSSMVLVFDRAIDAAEVGLTRRRVVTAR